MTDEPIDSPLAAEHEALGARFTDFAGWRMPLRYSGPDGSGGELAEHKAVRESAGQFDLSHMGEIEVAGPQAAELLDRAFVGELSKVKTGRAKYSLLCDADGGVLDDLITYRLADERFLVVANAANRSVVVGALTRAGAGLDAQAADRTEDTALIAVQGPDSQEIVTALMTGDDAGAAEGLRYYAAVPATVAGTEVLLARTGYTGEDGFELYAPRGTAVGLWRALLERTGARGGLPAGLACRDTLRLEAGMALYGQDLTDRTTPFEAGMGRMIRPLKQSDYTGRAALERLAAEQEAGRYPQRTLVGLEGDGRRAARPGYAVLDAEGARIGEITSGALSPTLGHPIALAYVDPAHREPGTALSVDVRGKHLPFTVAKIPFYKRG